MFLPYINLYPKTSKKICRHLLAPQSRKIYFYIVVGLRHLLSLSLSDIFNKDLYRKETLLVIEIINFTIESLALPNRHLNGDLSISHIKLL